MAIPRGWTTVLNLYMDVQRGMLQSMRCNESAGQREARGSPGRAAAWGRARNVCCVWRGPALAKKRHGAFSQMLFFSSHLCGSGKKQFVTFCVSARLGKIFPATLKNQAKEIFAAVSAEWRHKALEHRKSQPGTSSECWSVIPQGSQRTNPFQQWDELGVLSSQDLSNTPAHVSSSRIRTT